MYVCLYCNIIIVTFHVFNTHGHVNKHLYIFLGSPMNIIHVLCVHRYIMYSLYFVIESFDV